MRVQICAVGRLRKGAELSLIDDYQTRFNRTGRALGLGPLTITEVEDKKGGGSSAEADLLLRAIPKGSHVIALDERGKPHSSPSFANHLAQLRDTGTQDVTFLIGGADGLTPSLRDQAHHALSFGQMVWPHMLARVMLTEQLYRAATILSGGPYHRA